MPSSFQERIHCFIWAHQKRAVSGFKMKTRNAAFTVESRWVVRKKRLEENSECDQRCQCKSSISGRESMSQSFFSCTKMKKNILVTECCWPIQLVTTTDTSSQFARRYIHELTNTSEHLVDILYWCFKNDWGNKLPVCLCFPITASHTAQHWI